MCLEQDSTERLKTVAGRNLQDDIQHMVDILLSDEVVGVIRVEALQKVRNGAFALIQEVEIEASHLGYIYATEDVQLIGHETVSGPCFEVK